VVDDVAVIGSTNMDSQSMSFLWDASVVAYSPRLAQQLADRFLLDLARSCEIQPERWAQRPLADRVKQGASLVAEAWL